MIEQPKNLLLLGAGRRITLAELFINRGWNVFAYESSLEVPISEVAEVIVGKKWNDPEIIEDLRKIIVDKDISLVIPLMDGATMTAAILKEVSNWPFIVAAPKQITELCYDKRMFGWYMRNNFSFLYPEDNGTYPKFIKPVKGFGSHGCKEIFNKEMEDVFYRNSDCIDEYVIQKQLIGQEFTVDAFFLNGVYVNSLPRKRLRVADGEVISSETTYRPDLDQLTKLIGERLKLEGPVCMQFIDDIPSNRTYIIEINCRFGGGSILSMAAGLDLIGMVEKFYTGDRTGSAEITELNYNLKTERYFQETFWDTSLDWVRKVTPRVYPNFRPEPSRIPNFNLLEGF